MLLSFLSSALLRLHSAGHVTHSEQESRLQYTHIIKTEKEQTLL